MKDEALNKIIDRQVTVNKVLERILEDHYQLTEEVMNYQDLKTMRKNLKQVKKYWLYKPTDTNEKLSDVTTIFNNFSNELFEQARRDWIYKKYN